MESPFLSPADLVSPSKRPIDSFDSFVTHLLEDGPCLLEFEINLFLAKYFSRTLQFIEICHGWQRRLLKLQTDSLDHYRLFRLSSMRSFELSNISGERNGISCFSRFSIFLHHMSSSGGSASSTTGAPNCPRRDGDSTCTSVVNAPTDNDGGAPLRDGVPPGAESASIGQAALPTKVDWPSDLLCKLLVQSGVSNKFGNIEAIASQSTRGANDTVDVGTVVTDPTGLTASDKFATRPDELISVVLEHILPGLKKSTSPDNECIDATKITWGITQEGYNSSTLGSIKDAASAKFALSMNKESTRSTRSKCIHLLLLYCCMSWYVFVLVVLSHIHVSFASDPPCSFGWF